MLSETSSEVRGAMMALRGPGGELGGANTDTQVPMDQQVGGLVMLAIHCVVSQYSIVNECVCVYTGNA